MKRKKPNRKILSFDERILFVTRNFIEYGNYGKNPVRAVRVIHKHFPEMSPEEINVVFQSFVDAYLDAVAFLECHRDYYRIQHENRNQKPFFCDTDDEKIFYQKHRPIPEDIIRSMMYWIFDWRHVR